MVKKKTTRQKVREKEARRASTKEEGATSKSQENGETKATLVGSYSGRVKRKIAKQLRFLSKLQETQRAVGPKKIITKNKRKKQKRTKSALSNLSSLSEFLPSLDDQGSGLSIELQPKTPNAKARQKLVLNETKQLAKVLAHPVFKLNPYSAIQQHLASILGPIASGVESPLEKVKSSKKRKKKVAKDKMGLQDMERV